MSFKRSIIGEAMMKDSVWDMVIVHAVNFTESRIP